MRPPVSPATVVAAVAGSPVRHSLSPLMHNTWIAAAGLDAVYVAFELQSERFEAFVEGLRGGMVAGLNITIPFKERALALADRADPLALASGAANLLLFHPDGTIEGRNTDGAGLIGAFQSQAPQLNLASGPVAIFGAGGAARGAAAALMAEGCPEVRVINRTLDRALALAEDMGSNLKAFQEDQADKAIDGAVALINATSLGLGGGPGPAMDWSKASPGAVAMDMVYRPLRTEFLKQAAVNGHATVDGLQMLIGQAVPSFEALFGHPPPQTDVRTLLLAELEP